MLKGSIDTSVHIRISSSTLNAVPSSRKYAEQERMMFLAAENTPRYSHVGSTLNKTLHSDN